jgi:hypothetical protein
MQFISLILEGGELLFPLKLQKVNFYRYPSLAFPICWPGQHTLNTSRPSSIPSKKDECMNHKRKSSLFMLSPYL